ncbi:hypothetical protein EVAR_29092_1 [Eumeta japonica]|uniref:Uncharacterized protein n=1 Tax=Eumeta variegata TaxID=151549 RepID=A0A4C1VN83_EUMVA|nr:hypothetical protein EVAR_29092_1 [Eumeta japonica]
MLTIRDLHEMGSGACSALVPSVCFFSRNMTHERMTADPASVSPPPTPVRHRLPTDDRLTVTSRSTPTEAAYTQPFYTGLI